MTHDVPPPAQNPRTLTLDVTLRSQLRQVLDELGWSAAELGRRAKVSASTVTRALDSSSPFLPSSRTLDKMLLVLMDELARKRELRVAGEELIDAAAERIGDKVEQINAISDRYGLNLGLARLFDGGPSHVLTAPLLGLISPGRWESRAALEERLGLARRSQERLVISLPGEAGALVCYRFDGDRDGLGYKRGDLLVCKMEADTRTRDLISGGHYIVKRTLGASGLEELTLASGMTGGDILLHPELYAGGVEDAGPTVALEIIARIRAVLSLR